MRSIKKRYSSSEITVTWMPDECIHSTHCYKKLIEVFNPGKRPWIDMQGSTTEKIIDVIWKCPTNALTFEWNDVKKNTPGNYKFAIPHEPNEVNIDNAYEVKPVRIEISLNGPAMVRGNFVITHDNGVKLKMANTVSFCTCGKSHKQPYCDGSHTG